MRFFLPSWLVVVGLTCSTMARAGQSPPATANPQPASNAAADAAWDAVAKACQPPRPPEAWQTKPPTDQELDQFKKSEAVRLIKAAESAKDFASRFPNHSKAKEARDKEYEILRFTAARLGNTNVFERLDQIEEAKLRDPATTPEQRYETRFAAADRRAAAKLPQGRPAALAEMAKGMEALIKEYPNRPESYRTLLDLAGESDPKLATAWAKEVRDNPAAASFKDEAQALVRKLERIGQPLPIKFTAVDGRSVDLAGLRGKVVLVDFWATWCGPCMAELPNVLAAYQKWHPKGFEIVGISFERDPEKSTLLNFLDQQKMPWPQYFDGKYWENNWGKQFEIQSIPAMWLVDKKGNLRDIAGTQDLENKIERLLAENP